jgi:hypothetical protein
MNMKKNVIGLFILSVIAITFASAQERQKPQTKLEEIFLSKGDLLIREFYPLQKKGVTGDTSFDWIIVKKAGQERNAVSGLKVEISDYSRTISNKQSAFLDSEEVKELISSIDYFMNLSDQYRVQPPATYTEAYFSTKGDFKIGFYCDGKDMKGFMSAGSIGSVSTFFDIKKFPDIKSILEDAIAKYSK